MASISNAKQHEVIAKVLVVKMYAQTLWHLLPSTQGVVFDDTVGHSEIRNGMSPMCGLMRMATGKRDESDARPASNTYSVKCR